MNPNTRSIALLTATFVLMVSAGCSSSKPKANEPYPPPYPGWKLPDLKHYPLPKASNNSETARALIAEALLIVDPLDRCTKMEEAVALAKDADVPHYLLGLEYRTIGRAEAAVQEFQVCLEINPNFLEAAIQIAETRLLQGNFREAASDFENAKRVAQSGKDGLERIPFIMARIALANSAASRQSSIPTTEELTRLEIAFSDPREEGGQGGEPQSASSTPGSGEESSEAVEEYLSTSSKLRRTALDVIRELPPSQNSSDVLIKGAIALLDMSFTGREEMDSEMVMHTLVVLAFDLLYYASEGNLQLQGALPLVEGAWNPQMDVDAAQELARSVDDGGSVDLGNSLAFAEDGNSWVLRAAEIVGHWRIDFGRSWTENEGLGRSSITLQPGGVDGIVIENSGNGLTLHFHFDSRNPSYAVQRAIFNSLRPIRATLAESTGSYRAIIQNSWIEGSGNDAVARSTSQTFILKVLPGGKELQVESSGTMVSKVHAKTFNHSFKGFTIYKR